MGYNVNIEAILNLAHVCLQACENYEETRSRIRNSDAAEPSLAGSDGSPTGADSDLLVLVEEYNQYLKTTAARYDLAAENLAKAADQYTTTDEEQRDVFEREAEDLESLGQGGYSPGFNSEEEAAPTDRPDAAYTDLPDDGMETTDWVTDERSTAEAE